MSRAANRAAPACSARRGLKKKHVMTRYNPSPTSPCLPHTRPGATATGWPAGGTCGFGRRNAAPVGAAAAVGGPGGLSGPGGPGGPGGRCRGRRRHRRVLCTPEPCLWPRPSPCLIIASVRHDKRIPSANPSTNRNLYILNHSPIRSRRCCACAGCPPPGWSEWRRRVSWRSCSGPCRRRKPHWTASQAAAEAAAAGGRRWRRLGRRLRTRGQQAPALGMEWEGWVEVGEEALVVAGRHRSRGRGRRDRGSGGVVAAGHN